MNERRLWSEDVRLFASINPFQEDKILKQLIKKHGTASWVHITKEMKNYFGMEGRIGKQCRERWYNHLNPKVSKTKWSAEEEDSMFEQYRLLGNKWAFIARSLKGRTDNSTKNYFYSTLRRSFRRMNKAIGDKLSTQHMKNIKPGIIQKVFEWFRYDYKLNTQQEDVKKLYKKAKELQLDKYIQYFSRMKQLPTWKQLVSTKTNDCFQDEFISILKKQIERQQLIDTWEGNFPIEFIKFFKSLLGYMLKTSIEYNSKRFIELTLKKMEKIKKSRVGHKIKGHLAQNLCKKFDFNFKDIDTIFEKMVKKNKKNLFQVSIIERENKKEIIQQKTDDFLNHAQTTLCNNNNNNNNHHHHHQQEVIKEAYNQKSNNQRYSQFFTNVVADPFINEGLKEQQKETVIQLRYVPIFIPVNSNMMFNPQINQFRFNQNRIMNNCLFQTKQQTLNQQQLQQQKPKQYGKISVPMPLYKQNQQEEIQEIKTITPKPQFNSINEEIIQTPLNNKRRQSISYNNSTQSSLANNLSTNKNGKKDFVAQFGKNLKQMALFSTGISRLTGFSSNQKQLGTKRKKSSFRLTNNSDFAQKSLKKLKIKNEANGYSSIFNVSCN